MLAGGDLRGRARRSEAGLRTIGRRLASSVPIARSWKRLRPGCRARSA